MFERTAHNAHFLPLMFLDFPLNHDTDNDLILGENSYSPHINIIDALKSPISIYKF